MTEAGKVYLVGAGPGDAGLLTGKAKACLASADVVVYDRLVSPQILNESHPRAQLVYVGKEAHHHPVPQQEINAMLVRFARSHRTVVRLKGGDPFVFGRGSEEALALAEAGVPFEVVPGITSAIAVPAYMGIPVTHRQVATSFTVVTGHECVQGGDGFLAWAKSPVRNTLVILMGIGQLADIVQQLVHIGLPPEGAAAVIQWGTTTGQRSVVGTLRSIVQDVEREAIGTPSVIVIGEVVRFSSAISWFWPKDVPQRRLVASYLRNEGRPVPNEIPDSAVEVVSIALEDWAEPDADRLSMLVSSLQSENPSWYFGDPLDVHFAFLHLRHAGIDWRRFAHVSIRAADARVSAQLATLGIQADAVGTSFKDTSRVALNHAYAITGLELRLRHVIGAWEGLPFDVHTPDVWAHEEVMRRMAGLSAEPRWKIGTTVGGVHP